MSWKEMWAEARRMLATHAAPPTIVRHVEMMLAEFPVFMTPCEHCHVQAGHCVTPSGQPAETHKGRLAAAGALA